VPLTIISDGKAYRDWVDLSPTEAYQLFLKRPDAFSTSAPSPSEFLAAYKDAAADAESILCVTLSSGINSTYESARIGAEYADKSLPGVMIEVLDSGSATAGEGFLALAAARVAEAGGDLNAAIRAAEDVRKSLGVYVVLDTVKHVYRSGRIPKIAAVTGALLNIRVVFSVAEHVVLTGLVRSRERGIDLILQKIREKVGSIPVCVAVMHAYALEAAEQLKQRVAKDFNCAELWLTEFSPLMGYACGTGTLGLAFHASPPTAPQAVGD
jgi:DegV family protein with EDD domain